MRLTDEEIVSYAIANGVRSIRDNDLNTYYFLFGTTDEKEHWMRTTMYGNAGDSKSQFIGGCVLKDVNGRFSRLTFHQTSIRDGDFTFRSTYKNHELPQPQFIRLIEHALELNAHQIPHLAQQIRDMFVLDLTYKTEPYIELLSTSWDASFEFYRSENNSESTEPEAAKIINFPRGQS